MNIALHLVVHLINGHKTFPNEYDFHTAKNFAGNLALLQRNEVSPVNAALGPQ